MFGLLDWISHPTDERGLHFADDGDAWSTWTYAQLAAAACQATAELQHAGVSPDDVVAIVVPSSPEFVAAYFAVLLAGATPAPLVPPTFFEDSEEYVRRTAALLRCGVAHVVTEARLHDLTAAAASVAGIPGPPTTIVARDRCRDAVRVCPPAERALLQFSSGSSGQPRAVEVTYANVEANIAMFAEAFDWDPSESGASWLPMYHDMGLIACLLNAVTHQRSGWVMRPEQFVMDPLRWLERFGRAEAIFTAAPNFAFSYCVSKLRADDLEGMDFSRWQVAVTGAERVDPWVLGRFAELLEPFGFRREVLRPGYGLAEATLGVTMLREGSARAVRLRWDASGIGEPVRIVERAAVGDARIGDGSGWLVGCGTPFAGVRVMIVDDRGDVLPDGHLGEIRVCGPTVARGYAVSDSAFTRFGRHGLQTGDSGFIDRGELFVVGRLGDTLKVRGRTLYAEDLESRLAAVPGVPVGRCVVLPNPGVDGSVVALVERPAGPWVEAAARLLHREAGAGAHVRILGGQRGSIMRTTSGKPRRRVMWEALLKGGLAAVALYDSTDQPAGAVR